MTRETTDLSSERTSTARMPPPDSSRVFVGRNRELTEVLAALEDGSSGTGSLFLVSGDAGIGKTWLADEIARTAGRGGFQVLCGRGREGPGIPAYWPWIQILRGTGGSTNASAQPDWDHLAARLLGTAPVSPATVSSAAPGHDQFWLMDSTVHFLQRSAAAKPMLIVLDDLQWADDLSLFVLEFLAAELAGARLVVISVFREPEVRADTALRPIFGRLARLGHSLPLRGLCRGDVEEILARRFGLSVSPEEIDHLRELTGGNPWFIDQIVRLRLSEGPTVRAAPGRPAHLAIPEGIRAAVRRRLEPLTPEARDLLSIAAVMGNELSIAALEKVTGLSERDTLELLAQPAIRQIVLPDDRSPGTFRFCPPIVGEALYDDLTLPQRIELRRQIGEVVDGFSRPGDTAVAEIARLRLHAVMGKAAAPAGPWSTSTTRVLIHLPAEAPASARQPIASVPPQPDGDDGRRPVPMLESRGAPAGESVFRQEGEYWTIAYAGTTVRLKDAKGFRYLAQLLARPLLEVHVADLPLIVGGMTRNPDGATGALAAGLSVRRIGDAGQLLDAKAKEAYRLRLEDLQERLHEAQEFNDCERKAVIEEEMDVLAHELAASVGLCGRDRKAASAAERARVNVTRTIRAAIGKIAQGNPSLGQHLAVSIRTGTFCSYSPDPAVRPVWRV